MPRHFVVLGLATLSFLALGRPAQAIQVADPIGFYGTGVLPLPTSIAIDAAGDAYVVDGWTRRVEKFSKAGTHLFGWGGPGNGPGQFELPYGIAVDPSGTVFVVDVNTHRVQRFNSAGIYLGEFGTEGPGDGQLQDPRAVAADGTGHVYVADTYNHRVQKFTSAGGYVAQWGTPGAGQGQFSLPFGIAVDASGDVYVADTYNHRVQKFDGDGNFLRQWGGLGAGDGQFAYPSGLTVDASGNVYVTDTNHHRVQRFTSTGAFVVAWGTEGDGPYGQFQFPQGVAVDPRGDIHVADTQNERIQVYRHRFTGPHEPTALFGGPGTGDGLFSDIRGIAVSRDGFVFVADKNGDRLQKFTTFGAWAAAWGSSGDADGEFGGPTGVALDTSGVVYVTEHLNGRVQKFTPAGLYVGQWGSAGAGAGQFTGAWDIAIDAANRVYVVDGHRIQRFATDGTYVTGWSSPNTAGIGIDAEGFVYAACTSDHEVRKFTPDGTLVKSWGSFGSGPAQFANPSDVVCDAAGFVYVCDSNGRVQQFTPMGGYVKEWGEPGSAIRQLGAPQMMATDPAGNVYVTEFGNSRVQKFASPPEIVAIADVPGDEGGAATLSFARSSAEPMSAGGVLSQYRIVRIDGPIGVVVGNVAADAASTEAVIATGANATAVLAGIKEYAVQALTVMPGVPGLVTQNYGFSVDNLAPPAPNPFTAVYDAGATALHWGASPAPDLAEYRLYRGPTPPALVPANLIHASPDTGYADVGPAGGFYAIVAADTSGNVGAAASVGPEQTVDAPGDPAPAFAFAPARLELVNAAGRRVWSRAVSGGGTHAVRVAESDALAPGIYLARLVRSERSIVRRLVVLGGVAD
jgi:tripartite motif-containing protein 71